MTRYTYQTTITVTVDMADEGETYEGELQHWDTPSAQEESAREWADQAMPLHETYGEDWVEIDVPDLKLISKAPAAPPPAPPSGQHEHQPETYRNLRLTTDDTVASPPAPSAPEPEGSIWEGCEVQPSAKDIAGAMAAECVGEPAEEPPAPSAPEGKR